MSTLDITSSLDILVRDLRSPKGSERSGNVLQRAVFFLPTIRNERNIAVLVSELVHSANVLETPPLDLNSVFYLIEGIRSAADRKIRVTDPTIPPGKWVDCMLSSCLLVAQSSQERWRAAPVLAGLLLSKNSYGQASLNRKQRGLAQNVLLEIIHEYINVQQLEPLLVLSLAKVHNYLDESCGAKMNNERLLLASLSLIYRHPFHGIGYGSVQRLLQQPNNHTVFSHLSELSHLIKLLVENTQSPMALDEGLNMIIEFMIAISEQFPKSQIADDKLWNLYKLFLFGLSIQLQGFATVLISRRGFQSSAYFAAKILRNLGQIYFIVMQLSTSGFSAYEFVYYTCVDILFGAPEVNLRPIEMTARLLAGSVNIGAVNESLVDRGKIVYMLDFFEHAVAVCSSKFAADVILPITREFVTPGPTANYNYIQPVLESAHSALLAYFTKVSQTPTLENNSLLVSLIPDYLNTALSLFPDVLSYTQLNLAIISLVNVVSSPAFSAYDPTMIDRLLDELYYSIQLTPRGQPLPKDKQSEADASSDTTPPSVRAALASILVHSVAFIDQPVKFQWWLDNVQSLINTAGPDAPYLDGQLWKVISGELSLSMADHGIRWWYRSKI
ncbi:hypothetical protein TRICI_003260 [Trichomonascus ciferrii]|uniref:Peroxisomal membrane protein PEX17 n=1 Tax=Trichomonascus ciferrii TaxID=44093 RepID=A0A642V4K7_9ASCO|nr:hypothetical protein TRICI_003260 [Trichomonascus ciferrii]